MSNKVGLWLDQRTAYIFWDGRQAADTIQSNIRQRTHYGGGTRIGGSYNQNRDSELRHNDRYQHQLQVYFNKIVSAIKDAEAIYIFGPGEARLELEKILKKDKSLQSRLLKSETSDNLTEGQMRARVRDFYGDNN